MTTYNEIRIGKAGEYLVCSDLSLKGFAVFMNEQQIGYDIVCDTGKRLLRVQVKTCLAPRPVPKSYLNTNAYFYQSRCYGAGKRKSYDIQDIDVFAFVALDVMKVAYFHSEDVSQTMFLHPEENRGKFKQDIISNLHSEIFSLKGKMPYSEIASKLNISETTVGRILRGTHRTRTTEPRYFSDFSRSAEWF